MHEMSKLLRLAATILIASVLIAAGPPATPTVDFVETLFGMTFKDPYHWMEAGGPVFDTWLSAEASYTQTTLDDIPGRRALLEQIHRLNSAESYVGGTVSAGGQWFYSIIQSGDSVAKIFVRHATGGSV